MGALKELKHIIIIWYTDAIVTISTCKSLHRHRMARLYTKFNDFASHKSWVHIGCEVILQWRWEHGRGVTNSLGECLCVSQHSHVAKQLFIQLPYSCQTVAIQLPIQLPYSCHILVASLKWRCNKFIFNWRLRFQVEVTVEADTEFMPVKNATRSCWCCCW